MSEEQLRILKMIEDKRINAEDGAKLLNALTAATAAHESSAGAWPLVSPIPPIPPMPPMPPFDPFDFAFGRADRARQREARDAGISAREARRRRRDTEPFEAEVAREGSARFFHIKVTTADYQNTLVNVNLPVGLINFGLKLAARYMPEDAGLDFGEIQEAIRQGAVGKIIDIQHGTEEEPGTRVEISVE